MPHNNLFPKRFLLPVVTVASCVMLAGCGSGIFAEKDKKPLEGKRISVLELQEKLEPDDAALEAEGLVAPEPWKNAFWPQAGGYPNHALQNLELPAGPLKKLWAAEIGAGGSKELPLTAQPIVVDGRVFTLDTQATLSAFDAMTGKAVWRKDVGAPLEDDPVIGGGISYGAGLIYVTNGYNEIVAVTPSSGAIAWRKAISAPSRAAPTVIDGRVFVVTLDNKLQALSAADGSVLWEYLGIGELTGLVGAASPAANADIVVPGFSSGEITALRVENGSVAWSDNLSAQSGAGGLEALSDIKALPVIDKGVVFGMSFGGRLAAIDERSGTRIWQREMGGSNTPWVAGNHMFVLTSDNNLVALGRDNGVIRWVSTIKNAEDEQWFFKGPVMAGGRLLLAGTAGMVLEVNPDNGDILRQWDSGNNITIPPVIAAGVLYLLSDDGTLSAWK